MKKIGIGLCFCLFLLGACSENSEKTATSNSTETPQEINLVVDQEMSSMDSVLATDTYSITAINNVMEGLYRLSETNELIPAGAQEVPQMSEDGLTYTISLNENAVWSNGAPVTANDYVYAWEKAVSPETKAEYGYLFSAVKNAEEILAGNLSPDELGITAESEYKLSITLERRTTYFDYLLAFPAFFPQNEEFVSKQGSQYGSTSDKLIYNGPFVLTEFDGPGSDTSWTYEKNETYWDKDSVKLTKIGNQVVKESSTSVNLFETSEADDVSLTGELAKQYASDPAFVSVKKAGTTYVSYNQTKDIFKDKNVRQAISLAIDRDAIVNQILGDGSVVPTGLVPSGMSYSPSDGEDFSIEADGKLETDIEQAKELWEKAKVENDIDTLEISLVSYDADSIRKVAEYLQSALESTLDGLSVKVTTVPVSVAIERGKTADFDLFLFGWTADYPDPSSFLDLFTSESVYNYGKYNNENYDSYVNLANTSENEDDRWDNYIAAEKALISDMGVCPIIQKSEARLRNPKLKGVITHSTGAQFDYKEAYLE